MHCAVLHKRNYCLIYNCMATITSCTVFSSSVMHPQSSLLLLKLPWLAFSPAFITPSTDTDILREDQTKWIYNNEHHHFLYHPFLPYVHFHPLLSPLYLMCSSWWVVNIFLSLLNFQTHLKVTPLTILTFIFFIHLLWFINLKKILFFYCLLLSAPSWYNMVHYSCYVFTYKIVKALRTQWGWAGEHIWGHFLMTSRSDGSFVHFLGP